jgi:cytoskeleton protein RodZ
MDETTPANQSPAAAAPAPVAAPRTIGQRLRAGRERAGLSMAAAAEKLHLDPKVIEALEADRFSDLGASVYVRGHLRRYGDFVGEPGAELVNLYSARDVPPPPPDLTQIPQAERSADPRRLTTPLVGLGCAVVLAGALWWVLGGAKPGTTTTQTTSTTTAPAGDAASAVPASPANPPAAATSAPVPPAASPAALPVAVPAGSPAATPVTAASAATTATAERREEAPARPTQLRLELNSESWVEVYDSRGTRLYFDVASAGSVQSIEGRPPLRVVLGNAAAVAVQVNGEAREIPAGAANGEGASFVVNRSGTLSRSRQ